MEVAMVDAVLKSSMGRMRRRSRMCMKQEHQRFVQSFFWKGLCEGSYVGSTQVVKSKTYGPQRKKWISWFLVGRLDQVGGRRKQGQSMQRSFGGLTKTEY